MRFFRWLKQLWCNHSGESYSEAEELERRERAELARLKHKYERSPAQRYGK